MFDVIVLGSGPGGSSTACIFAEAGLSVVLLEEGSHIQQSKLKPFSIDEMDSKYRAQGVTVAMGSPKINYIEGQVVGGGSESNSGLYFAPDQKNITNWADEFDIKDFSYAELMRHSLIIENDINICAMPVEPPLASRKLSQGAEKMNWSAIEVPRWIKYDQDSSTGVRQSMSETYIPRFLQAGGKLISNTKANKIKKMSNAWDVMCSSDDHDEVISAKSVFVACGAIQTPLLLRKSGFKKNIGNVFKMHPTVKVIAKFPEVLNSSDLGVPVHQVKQFAPAYSFGCAISLKEFLAAGLIDYPDALKSLDTNWIHMISYYAMSTGGQGYVRNLPFNLGDYVKYNLKNADLALLSEALKNLCKLLFASGATELYPSLSGMDPIKSLREINTIPEQLDRNKTSLMSIHLMSGCPMGENLSRCAVNSYGKVHGTDGLYISDSSILCSAVGYNPQGTTLAIVRRNALNFLETQNNL